MAKLTLQFARKIIFDRDEHRVLNGFHAREYSSKPNPLARRCRHDTGFTGFFAMALARRESRPTLNRGHTITDHHGITGTFPLTVSR